MRAEAYRIMEASEESYWWYRVRRAIIADAVERSLPRGSELLDYGAGNGATAAELRRRGYDVRVADHARAARDACGGRGLPVVEIDELPRHSGRFDGVLACDVLEHVDDDLALLATLRDLLRPGGRLLVTVPAHEFLWSGEDYISEHVRRYTRRGLDDRLRASGFLPDWRSGFNTLLLPAVAAAILWKRVFRPREMYRSNIVPLAPWLDAALGRVFALERRWLRRGTFPSGTSLIALARRGETS